MLCNVQDMCTRMEDKVKLSELQDETAVSFELYIGANKFEFPSVMHFQRKGKAYFEPIRIDGKLLKIQNEKIHANLLQPREGEKPVMWPEVDAREEIYKKAVYYTIDSECKGKSYNRRSAYRQYVGEEVFAKVGTGKPDIQVVLKDISNTGFSFVYREEIKDSERAMVLMTYIYKDENASFDLTLSGKVVRKQQLEDGRILYGCVLVKKNDLISKFVNYKQKEQLNQMSYVMSNEDRK